MRKKVETPFVASTETISDDSKRVSGPVKPPASAQTPRSTKMKRDPAERVESHAKSTSRVRSTIT